MENITITARKGPNYEFKFFCSRKKMRAVLFQLLNTFNDVIAIDSFTGEVQLSYYATKEIFRPYSSIEKTLKNVREILEKEG